MAKSLSALNAGQPKWSCTSPVQPP